MYIYIHIYICVLICSIHFNVHHIVCVLVLDILKSGVLVLEVRKEALEGLTQLASLQACDPKVDTRNF